MDEDSEREEFFQLLMEVQENIPKVLYILKVAELPSVAKFVTEMWNIVLALGESVATAEDALRRIAK